MNGHDDRAWLIKFLSSSGPGRTLLHLRKGDTLFRKGTDADEVYMVQSGQIGLIDHSRTQEICGPNRWLFESAHELGHVFLQTAVALQDSGVMAFRSDMFLALLTEHPALQAKFLEDMAERITEKNNSNDPAGKRLARQLLGMVGNKDVMMVETTPTRLGELIGISRQRVDKILKAFGRAGMVVKVSTTKYRLHRVPIQRYLESDGEEDGE